MGMPAACAAAAAACPCAAPSVDESTIERASTRWASMIPSPASRIARASAAVSAATSLAVPSQAGVVYRTQNRVPAAARAAAASAGIAPSASSPFAPAGAAWTKPGSGVTQEVITLVTSIHPWTGRFGMYLSVSSPSLHVCTAAWIALSDPPDHGKPPSTLSM